MIRRANTKKSQWYLGDEGERLFKKVYGDFKRIALRGEVDVCRDSKSQDIIMQFSDMHYKRRWEVLFPSRFPVEKALLIELEDPGTSEEHSNSNPISEILEVRKILKNVIDRIVSESLRGHCGESDVENVGESSAATDHPILNSGGKCGSSRGHTDCIALIDCDGDISLHLANHHLSRENTCERDLILARAGLLELTEEQIKNMMVCTAHRFTLGKYWQAPKTCQYPRHHGKKSAVTGTHVINFKLAREIKNFFGEAAPVGSPICTTCRKKHAEDIVLKTDWLYPKEPEEMAPLQRPAKEAAVETIAHLVISTPFREPSAPQNIPETPCWTPGSEITSPATPLVTDIVDAYSSAMDTIANLTAQEVKREPLSSKLKTSLNNLSKAQQLNVLRQASEDCLLVCSVIAPGSGEELFESMTSAQREKCEGPIPDDLVVLMNAKTRNLRKQILSLYAYRYPMSKLQEIHQPYGKLTKWEIKQARSHAKLHGPGTIPEATLKHRVRLDMEKVEHFVEFTNRPYFYQDVSYGSKILTLDSGEKIEMPHVVRTVTRSTMIEQYLEYCKEQCYEPLSRSTLFKILEVRKASQRKSLQGLDNTAADGAAGFETLDKLLETLEKGGKEKQWCLEARQKLRDAKRYLKTEFRVNCQPNNSTCADHCRNFALSDPVEPEFQKSCSHQHLSTCDDCQGLKKVLQELRLEIEGPSCTPVNSEQREDLLYDFDRAKSDILLWKAHIVRSINQEEAKQDLLKTADATSAIVIMDWAMKFLQLKYREKQSEGFGKRGLSWHISTVITKNVSTGKVELQSYAHILDSCQQDWYAVCSIIENTLEALKKEHPHITQVNIRSDEAGCYYNNLLVAAVKDAGNRVGITVTRYDFSEPQYGKDVFKEARIHNATSTDGEETSGLFPCPEPGCLMVFRKVSELENHLDVGEHRQMRGGSETVYDKLRRDWAEKFLNVDNNEGSSRAPVAHCDERGDEFKYEAHSFCTDLQLGWALHKARNQGVRFPDDVKQYLTRKFDLGERTGNKTDPGKVAADMRTARRPDGLRIFDRKDWLTKSQVQVFFSRLAATRRKQGNQELQMEDVYAEEEEEERCEMLESVAAELSPRHPICYDSYCLCDLARDESLDSFSVVMLKEILRYFEIPFGLRDRKKI
ncbi:hypothetical protein ACROYT_G005129 [Oculina patagonica]